MRRCLAVLSLAVACGPPPSPSPRSTPAPAVLVGAACPGASLLPVPADLAQRGPWAVGARTVVHDGLTLEVWYPAPAGSDAGAPHVQYDLRTVMPAAEAAKIPDADNAYLPCECARDLPVDAAHGPYPVVVFFHGAASFRAQSAFLASHWASRGFIVIAPDVRGIGLAAALGETGGSSFAVPVTVMDLVSSPPAPDDDPLAFIRAHLDAGKVALAGHSLGSVLASSVSERPEVAVRIAMAGSSAGDDGNSLLVLAGDHDSIAPATGARQAFAQLARRGSTRLGILQGAGHLAFSDLCALGADRGGSLAIARAHGVKVPEIVASLATDGCKPTDAPIRESAPAIRALTSGVLEETLHCDRAATAALHGVPAHHPIVELSEQLK